VSAVRRIVLHGHFYQPPRENPTTGSVEREPTAAPDHDWNARVTRECYAPLTAIPVGEGHDPPRLNAWNFLSTDTGPTLLDWLEREAPDVYAAILRGDRAGRERVGHGNAMAAPYHHVILPLSSRRDKTTEVRWGIADFERRFGRRPEGMWLPETAVDDETLDVLAQEGIVFTVLAPHQVKRAPPNGHPGIVRTGGGRRIVVFPYDGPRSHDVAFGSVTSDALAWERSLLQGEPRSILTIATDGETYGHHHRFADLALGKLLYDLNRRRSVRVTNFAEALAVFPATVEVELVAPTSWSCAHGIERWRGDCGCRQTAGTQQRWRAPLRQAVDWLLGEVHARFERDGAGLPGGPWAWRDAIGATRPVEGDDESRRLAEMERAALRALTSCGWFFDDFAGLEGRQVLRYVARAIALTGPDAPGLEAGFLARLDGAQSNDRAAGTAQRFYTTRIRPEVPA
jgi:alpha-amylase/alpha-mannosidase (GH57 family)